MNRNVWRRRAAWMLMGASGFAGLGYQIVWTQQSALWLGHESAAVLAVVAAFFGGLATGALALGRRIESSDRPARWYAACELTIGLWSLLLAFVLPYSSVWLLHATGPQPSPAWQWMVAFCGTFVLLLPATAAMGATMPAMERVLVSIAPRGRSIAALYACNTFGAVVGVLSIAFWLIPVLGLARTAVVCVVSNLICSATSLILFPAIAVAFKKVDTSAAVSGDLPRLALTGLLGIGYEVLVVRVLSQVAQDTVYTFALLLAVYLLGSAAGAAAYERWRQSARDSAKVTNALLSGLAMACLAGTASLWAAEDLQRWTLAAFEGGMHAALAAEAGLAIIAFGPATVLMGALFSHLSAGACAAGHGFGRAVGVNTLGAAAAPLMFGVLAFPTLGPKISLLLVSCGYLALITWRQRSLLLIALPAGVAIAVALWAPRLAFVDVPEGGRILSFQDGTMATVSVVEDAQGIARLRIDNRQQEGSSGTRRVDSRQALLPLLLHAAPRHALFLGLGTGVTASAATEDPAVQVEVVELLPEVLAASRLFVAGAAIEGSNARLHPHVGDARRYVRTVRQRYDVIVSDNFHPARSGSGSLYSVEHFQAVRERLEPDGIFCQWLPLHQLDRETLRSIVQSFISVYPQAAAMIASNSLETPVIGLVARAGGSRLTLQSLKDRLARFPSQSLTMAGIEDEFALLGGFFADAAGLRRFARGAIANTDDRPVVAYLAPRVTYAPDSRPGDRLIALLQEFSIDSASLIEAGPGDEAPRRLVAYWAARNRFIEAGRHVEPLADVRGMLAQVREPLLSVLRISPDFRPAYDPLLMMAGALMHSDAPEARTLLMDLVRIQPARPEARRALQEITDATH